MDIGGFKSICRGESVLSLISCLQVDVESALKVGAGEMKGED